MLLSLVLVTALSVLDSHAPAERTTWKVGEPAPHIHLPEITTGKPFDLASLRGKKVLIAEFASW